MSLARPLVSDRTSAAYADPVVWLACALMLLVGFSLYPGAGPDDAYMTFWAADMLVEQGAVLNYNGDAIAQSSTLGFVVAIALVQWTTGLTAAMAGKLLAVCFGLGACLLVAAVVQRHGSGVGRAEAFLLGSNAYFVFWSQAGMEGTLAALSGLAAILILARILDERLTPSRHVALTLLMVIYVSSRPEAFAIFSLIVLGAGIVSVIGWHLSGRTAARREQIGRIGVVAGTLAAVIGLLLAIQIWTTGVPFPEPVYAKADAPGISGFRQGLDYLVNGSTDSGKRLSPFVLLVGAAAIAAIPPLWRTLRSGNSWTLASLGLFFAANLAFVFAIGGDGMPANRFLIPAVPAAVVLCVAAARRWLPRRAFAIVLVACIVIQVADGVALSQSSTMASSYPLWAGTAAPPDSSGRFNWFERMNYSNRRYVPAVVALERSISDISARTQPVSILSGQSGFVIYHVFRRTQVPLRYIDRFGLVTRDFRSCGGGAFATRSVWGLEISIEHYLENRQRFLEECGIRYPDIIFDLTWDDSAALEQRFDRAGYTLTYFQDADQTPEGDQGRAFVAVRR